MIKFFRKESLRTILRNNIKYKRDAEVTFHVIIKKKCGRSLFTCMMKDWKSAEECTVHHLHVAFYIVTPSSPVSQGKR